MKLGEFPDENRPVERSAAGGSSLQGLSVDELTTAVARQLEVPAGTEGVVVVNVKRGSPAAEAGLRRGDVIRAVARQPVANVAEFREAINKAGDSVLLLLQRGDNPFFVVLEAR